MFVAVVVSSTVGGKNKAQKAGSGGQGVRGGGGDPPAVAVEGSQAHFEGADTPTGGAMGAADAPQRNDGRDGGCRDDPEFNFYADGSTRPDGDAAEVLNCVKWVGHVGRTQTWPALLEERCNGPSGIRGYGGNDLLVRDYCRRSCGNCDGGAEAASVVAAAVPVQHEQATEDQQSQQEIPLQQQSVADQSATTVEEQMQEQQKQVAEDQQSQQEYLQSTLYQPPQQAQPQQPPPQPPSEPEPQQAQAAACADDPDHIIDLGGGMTDNCGDWLSGVGGMVLESRCQLVQGTGLRVKDYCRRSCDNCPSVAVTTAQTQNGAGWPQQVAGGSLPPASTATASTAVNAAPPATTARPPPEQAPQAQSQTKPSLLARPPPQHDGAAGCADDPTFTFYHEDQLKDCADWVANVGRPGLHEQRCQESVGTRADNGVEIRLKDYCRKSCHVCS